MGRRGRSFFGLVVVGCGAVAVYFWRNRHRYRSFLTASDCVRDFVKRAIRRQAGGGQVAKPKPIITGLTAPECRPLSSPDDLLAWSPDPTTDPDAPFCQTYNAPLMAPPAPLGEAGSSWPEAAAAGPGSGGGAPGGSGRPRLLVCHDMMGGYLEDRWVQGAADPGFFRFWQWDQIDTFIYFSHHLVTLPPPGWIAAAHRNGVRVLGTFITEWASGRTTCEALLASPASARAAADRLAALAAHHGFDGWLVNIENGLPRGLVANLVTFVGHLRARMAAVVGPQALVVWYDAITMEGRLAWQDGLTPLNGPFFDAADALFVNYRWREGAPEAVAAAAGSRAADVYLGVDVFGRGSFGGGKDNCPVALHAARAAGVSAALFAPGWVFEEFPRDTFEQRQELFWARIREVWPPRPATLQRLPLASCFNAGVGRGVWLEGRRVSSAPWFNLSAQDPVPATTLLATTTAAAASAPGTTAAAPAVASPLIVRPTPQLAFSGGACLALRLAPPEEGAAGPEGLAAPPPPTAAGGPWLHDLYTAHIAVPPAGLDLSYTMAGVGSSRVAVLLRTAPAAAATGLTAGSDPRVGLAVGPWGPGDRATVETLRRIGYTCVACPGNPTGAVTCPLPEPGASAAVAATSAAAAAVAASGSTAFAGLPWITCCARLPYGLFEESAGGGGGPVISAVGVVCYRTAAAAAAAAVSGGVPATAAAALAAGGSATSGGGGGGRLSARGSATGFSAAASAAAGGGAEVGDGVPYQAFLGRLVLGEHRPGRENALQGPATAALPEPPTAAAEAVPTAAAAAGSLGLPLAGAAPPPPRSSPLSGARCFRVRWSRPGCSRPRSLRAASFTSLAGGVGKMHMAAVAGGGVIDPRVSGELVDSGEGVDVEDDDDEDWERSSGAGGGTAGGSPVKVHAPGALDDGDGEGGVLLGGGAGGDAEVARLLTCELSWEPQFEVYGTPRHRSYHIWAHFSAAAAPAVAASPGRGGASAAKMAAAAGGRLPQVPSPAALTSPGAAPGGGGGGGADDRESAWEVLHPDWSGAVWAGEAFVARYRLVELEVPGWARCVTLLVQPVGWQAAEPAAQLQQLATLGVPQQATSLSAAH